MDQSATVPLLGLVGHKVAGNPMQFAMEQALRAANLDWRFLSFDISPEVFPEALRGIDVLGFRGVSIASPYGNQTKTAIPTVTATGIAATTGWIDVLSRDETGGLVGHHLMGQVVSDLIGAERLGHSPVAVLGNTPKTLALAHALIESGAKQVIVPQASTDQLATLGAEDVTNKVNEDSWSQLAALIRGSSGNGQGEPTSCSEKEISRLDPQCVVVDQAIPASTTPLLRYAAERGHIIHSLIDLLVLRASAAFLLWTDQPVDPAPLREAFEEFLEI